MEVRCWREDVFLKEEVLYKNARAFRSAGGHPSAPPRNNLNPLQRIIYPRGLSPGRTTSAAGSDAPGELTDSIKNNLNPSIYQATKLVLPNLLITPETFSCILPIT